MGKVKVYFITVLLLSIGFVLMYLEFGTTNEKTQKANATKNEDHVEMEANKLHFNLSVNNEYLTMLHNRNQELVAGNKEKFGEDMSKSSIDLHVDLKTTYANDEREEYEAAVKGVVKSVAGDNNFNGAGTLHKVKLSNNEWIYSGSFEGTSTTQNGEETFMLTLRYNPATEESDVVFTSGLLGNTGILPFGQPFLMEDQLDEIQAIIAKPVSVESTE
ncbi:hypothetical protein [Sporosarcina sp. OR05]|uniref:hypothetical protein n=1 Tax=Sporosarcina sp. OR05 TaxID=2969819 RepID=UPI00352B2725